jgi:hypothetical protein
MTINKCDKCGVEIEAENIQVGVGFGYRVELCKTCAEPVIQFLKNSQLLVKQLQRYGFIESDS